ncbi:MAG: extracellular solute-binding protein [bacterium]|nr:extracellular solute-binding protein [bacterium]
MKNSRFALFLLILLPLVACAPPPEEFWIYTSTYKEVCPLYEPGLRAAFPGVAFRWYQSGSEKIAAKILAEEKGGGTQADLLMTSDLFFYQELKKLDLLLPLSGPGVGSVPPGVGSVPAVYRDPDHAFAINRLPLMVIAYNREKITGDEVPASFEDLVDPRYEGRLTMPSPLESGSALTTALYLHQRFGPPYFEALRRVDVLAAGGNGATLSRIQSGERPVGIVLLENLLKVEEMGLRSVAWVVPEEGALPVPAPLAILRGTDDVELARRVLDWFFSEEARSVVVKGWIHSVFPEDPAPAGAPAFAELELHPWDLVTFAQWGVRRQEVKTLFQKTVLE